ncbi:MAG TPA: alpha/beta hydrolase [Blastocatellia bacterium]|nr:alpha/beta hydrolase [Blastocatellia bacterium]
MTKFLSYCLIAVLCGGLALSLSGTNLARDAKPEDRFAKLDSIRVHYQNYGQGQDAVVMIHGWSCNLNFWKANAPALAGHSRVITIDLPGHGQSDKPQTAYSMDLFARAVDAVLQDAKVERATLVGHSMGTPVIRQFYRHYPAKTRALVIVDGSLQPFGNKAAMEKFLAPLREPTYKQAAESMIGFMVTPIKDPATRDEVKTAMLSTPQHVMTSAFDGMLDESIWKNQDPIQVPALVVMAKRDSLTPEYERFVRGLIPGVDYQLWDGVSHFLMMDEPQKFNDAVTAFLKKNQLIKN